MGFGGLTLGAAGAQVNEAAGRTVADIVADVEVVADHLGVGQFAVSGGSEVALATCPRLRSAFRRSCLALPCGRLARPRMTRRAWTESEGMAVGNVKWSMLRS